MSHLLAFESLCPLEGHTLKTTPRICGGRTFGRRLGHEGRALTNGIGALIKGTLGNSVAPSATRGPGEKLAVTEPGSGSSQILDFLASRTARDTFLYEPPNLWCSIIADGLG